MRHALTTGVVTFVIPERVATIGHLHPGSGAISPSARTCTRLAPCVLARNMFIVT